MKNIVLLSIISLLFIGCGSNDNGGGEGPSGQTCLESFNRKEMLIHWADNIIMPAYTTYSKSLVDLNEKVETFNNDINIQNLEAMREAFKNAYMKWETVAFFDFGPADSYNLILFSNTYPAAVKTIKENIEKGNEYQFHKVSTMSQQGLPTLDYLINGVASDDKEILQFYKGDTSGKNKKYLLAVANRLKDLTSKVEKEWKDSYRGIFIKNSASSSTASVDKVANAYLLYYEKYLRNGKVRFPSGAVTEKLAPEKVESLYDPKLSLPLLIKSLESMQNFFNGKLKSSDEVGLGFRKYLEKYYEVNKGNKNIAEAINKKFTEAIDKAKVMESQGTLYYLIKNKNKEVLDLHDIIQSNVINMKVDMFQAMCISVGYNDGDGD